MESLFNLFYCTFIDLKLTEQSKKYIHHSSLSFNFSCEKVDLRKTTRNQNTIVLGPTSLFIAKPTLKKTSYLKIMHLNDKYLLLGIQNYKIHNLLNVQYKHVRFSLLKPVHMCARLGLSF